MKKNKICDEVRERRVENENRAEGTEMETGKRERERAREREHGKRCVGVDRKHTSVTHIL